MREGVNTVTRCALLIEVEGNIHQAFLDQEKSILVLKYATELYGGTLNVSEPLESITLSEPINATR